MMWLMYAGFTQHEVIAALDRIPHRYTLAERMRFLKRWKKYD
jgi:hypothetical protein